MSKRKLLCVIPTILTIVALILGVTAPVAFAENPVQDGFNQTVSEIDIANVERLQKEARLLMEEQIVPPQKIDTDRYWGVIVLGANGTFYDASAGSHGSGRSGWAHGIWQSNYILSSRQAEGYTFVGPIGWGNAWAWANVGKQFYVEGTGSQSANLTIDGRYIGRLHVVGGAQCDVKIELVLYNYTTGSYTRTTVLSERMSLAGMQTYNRNFTRSMPVHLHAGHHYVAYLEVSTSAGYVVTGTAASNFGTGSGGDNGYARYNYLRVDF